MSCCAASAGRTVGRLGDQTDDRDAERPLDVLGVAQPAVELLADQGVAEAHEDAEQQPDQEVEVGARQHLGARLRRAVHGHVQALGDTGSGRAR